MEQIRHAFSKGGTLARDHAIIAGKMAKEHIKVHHVLVLIFAVGKETLVVYIVDIVHLTLGALHTIH